MSDRGPIFIWERVNKYYQSTRKTVHVAVAYTADAAAASHTLASLLKASLISYDVQPVATVGELREMIASANLAQDYARESEGDAWVEEMFILVGLGGALPLFRGDEFFSPDRHVVVVLDSCRPFHLDNLRDEERSFTENGADTRLLLWGSERLREEVDGFFRNQREVAAARRRRRRRRAAATRARRLRQRFDSTGKDLVSSDSDSSSGSGSGSSSASELGAEAGDTDDESVSASASQEHIDWLHEEGDVPPYLEVAYYACERAGRSCAVEMYDLAVLLNRFKDATLWHAAVGVCDLFLRRLIDYGTYVVEMQPLHNAVALQRSVRRVDAAAVGGDDGDAEERDGSGRVPRSRGSNAMELHSCDDEQLLLLRHTSLWNAIWLHPLTASVLRLHHVEDGEGELQQLLARCGVSVKVAQQPWREVPLEDRTAAIALVQAELQRRIDGSARFLGHPNRVRCVSRKVGYGNEVSTFDACALHEALLAAAPPPSVLSVDDAVTADMDAAAAEVARRQKLQRALRAFELRQFWKAHAALDIDPNHTDFLSAVRETLRLQNAVAVATSALMQPGMLQSMPGIHYMVPCDPARTTTALETFRTLPRLGALARRLLLTLTVERGLGRYSHAVRPLLLTCAVPQPLLREVDDDSFAAFGGTSFLRDIPLNGTKAVAAKASVGGSTDRAAIAGSGGGSVGASVSGGSVGYADSARDATEFMVLLVHEGTQGAALTPLPAVGRFLQCIADEDEFEAPPQRRFLAQRDCVVVPGRDVALHLEDLVHLASRTTRWDPQRDYMTAIADAQEAQRRDAFEDAGDDDVDDSAGDDEPLTPSAVFAS